MSSRLYTNRLTRGLAAGLAFVVLPMFAQAHSGLGHTHGFVAGTGHPVFGFDHVCAMIAVGLWAAQRGGRAIWAVPATFVAVMAAGGMLGAAGVSIPLIEPGIAGSVLILGLLIAAAVRLPVAVSSSIVGLFAIFHGYAHGAEMATDTSGLAYGAGFVLVTGMLHLAGLGLGWWMARAGHDRMVRLTGAAIAACGVVLCMA